MRDCAAVTGRATGSAADPRAFWRQLVGVKLLGKRPDRIDYHPHMSASELRGAIGKTCWNAYFKFVVERNPWDRQVSYWQFSRTRRTPLTCPCATASSCPRPA